MFTQRKLKDLSQFEQYAEDYLNKAYRLGAHALPTIGMTFLASLPKSLGNIVLDELSHKNILVENLNLVDLQQIVRQELKKLCYRLKANTELPKVGRNICRQIDGAEEHNLPRRFKPRKKGHYANKCPNRAPRQIKMMFEVPEIEQDWDLIENEAEFEECLKNKNVFYLAEEEDDDMSIITESSSSSEAVGHICMVAKKDKEVLIDESDNLDSDDSTSESGSDIEREIYSDDDVPIVPNQQEKRADSEKGAKALLDKGTVPINFWDFTPKNSLKNSKIKQIKKMSLSDISIIIPVQIAVDKNGKWKKGQAFIHTGANMNFCKKEIISSWLYYPKGTRVETMNGERRLHNFALNVPVKIGEKTISANFVQIDDAGHDIGIGSVTLDEIGPYTICKDCIVFRIGKEQQVVPRLSASFKWMQNKGKKKDRHNKNLTLLQIMKQELKFEEEVNRIKAIKAINLLPGQRIDCLPEFKQVVEKLKSCCVEHPLQFWDKDSPTAHIPTVHNIPVQSKPIVGSELDRKEILVQIQELEEKGLIRRSESHYASASFIVRNHA
ncbi:ORF V Enzymatic polyprotein [Nymphaea thermarum]|nr:ORF V Enzymatic polyprotein [Nymphaea thermarum]